MSNIYATAIERSSASQSEPITAINTLRDFSLQSPVEKADLRPRVVTPFAPNYPETPLTAQPISPQQSMDFVYPSTMTATPPLSAGAVEKTSQVFTFSSAETSSAETSSLRSCRRSCRSTNSPLDDRTPRRRRAAFPSSGLLGHMPYTHPRSLHSILRNSPLPPRTAIPPPSPGRQSLRLREKAAKRVEYDSPLEEEITTFKYTRSHIELLAEDGSPLSPANALSVAEPERILDKALLEFTAREIQDGGQTPGPFEGMRRGMAGLGDASPISPNPSASTNRKRKRTEKKRQWVWTIGQEENDEHVGGGGGGAIAAIRVQAADKAKTPQRQHALAIETTMPSAVDCEDLPTPSVESSSSFTDLSEVEMSDSCSIVSSDDHPGRCLSVPLDTETGAKTPTAPNKGVYGEQRKRDTPIPELAERGDDPDPPRTAPTCA